MKGKLITFEGIEGCGKSTQALKLRDFLVASGRECVMSREPGGTSLGAKIRSLLLGETMTPRAELFLFLADRNQHIHEVIQPALSVGKIVILDRYYHSTYAYQAAGRLLNVDEVRLLNEQAIEGVRPDLTFYVDVPVEVGFARKQKAEMALDRIEMETKEFHENVRRAFLSFDGVEDNFVQVDGTRNVEEIHQYVVQRVEEILS